MELAKLQVDVDVEKAFADVKSLRKELKALRDDFGKQMSGLRDDTKETAKEVKSLSSNLRLVRQAIVAYGGLRIFRGLIGEGIRFNAELERSTVAFKTLLGSMDAAKERMTDLVKFAAETPFLQEEVIGASRTLQALTNGALASGEGLRLVGDAAAAVGRDFRETAMWLGRLYAGLESGTPVGEATLRLLEMGLISGETSRRLNELAKAGAQGSDAMDTMKEVFGSTSGAMKDLSQTAVGLQSTLSDTWSMMAGEVSQSAFEYWKESLTGLLRLLGAMPPALEEFRGSISDMALEAAGRARGVGSERERKDASDAMFADYERLRELRGQLMRRQAHAIHTGRGLTGDALSQAIRDAANPEALAQELNVVELAMRSIVQERQRMFTPSGQNSMSQVAAGRISANAGEWRQQMFGEEDAYFDTPEYQKSVGQAAFERWEIEQKGAQEALAWRMEIFAEEDEYLEKMERENKEREYSLSLIREQKAGYQDMFQSVANGAAMMVNLWGDLNQRLEVVGATITDSIDHNMTQALTGMITGTKDVGEAFRDMSNAIIQDLVRVMVQQLVVRQIMQGISAIGAVGGAGGGPTTTGGGTYYPVRHAGGMADWSGPSRMAGAAAFVGSRRYHMGGFAADEVPIIAHRGEKILTEDQQAVSGKGAGKVEIINVVDPRMIDERLSSNPGAILNAITKDPRPFRRVLGLPS